MNELWIPLFPFAVFFAWLFFFGMGRGKSCPDCAKALPLFQSPFTKTKRQWVEGGYVCQNCGCEVDIAGAKVAAGTAPQRRSIIIGIGLLMLAVVPAFVLLIMLFQP
jgi:hypothetical protein